MTSKKPPSLPPLYESPSFFCTDVSRLPGTNICPSRHPSSSSLGADRRSSSVSATLPAVRRIVRIRTPGLISCLFTYRHHHDQDHGQH